MKNCSSVRGMSELAKYVVTLALAVAGGCLLSAQALPESRTVRTAMTSSGNAVYAPRLEPASPELVREIDDPHTGQRWLLYRDPAHPGGPGRLVLAAANETAAAGLAHREGPPASPAALPVIRTGDRVVLEEETAAVEARLEAVALGPAAPGAPLRVRLAIGGKVLAAIALTRGRVALAPQAESRP